MRVDWKDDVFEDKRKYNLINNSDGTVSLEDATTYVQQGDSFGAKELIEIGEEVNALASDVSETKKSVSDGKALIAAAITLKRVATAATDAFATMAENIAKIVLGSGNAATGDVLKGKTFTNDDGVEYTGTMADNSGTTKLGTASLDTTNSRIQLAVPEEAKYSLTSKLYATYATIRSLIGLTEDKLWTGVTILGLKSSRTGLGAKTYTPGTTNQTIASGTCLTGAQTIKGDSNLKAANIKKGVNIFGVTGTWEGYVAAATDLYYYGQNKCGLSSDSSYAQFQDTQVLIGYNHVTFTTNSITFTGYSKLNFLVQPCGLYSENTPIGVDISKPFSLDTEVSGGNSTTQKTISVPLSNFQSAGSLTFKLTNIGSTNGKGKLLRIWLS